MRGRSIATSISLCFAFCVIACGPPPRNGDDGSGDDGTGGADAPEGECAKGTEFVYVIDQFANKLSQFNPATKQFMDIGALNACPVSAGATPFSMGVDRSGMAWVLYNNGQLMKAAIVGLQCTATTWSGANGMKVFGMGFSTNMPGGNEETLFIGGGTSQTLTQYTLAAVNPQTMAVTPLGMEPQLPEMTGNGKAELWGFFPDATHPKVVMFDKTNGSIAKSFDEPTLAGTMTGYAFAHWGGDYWVFLLKNGETSTTVYQVDGMTGAIKSTTPAPGRTIVGAGVSTCAPTVIQ
jgi:hypothetical protein